MSVNWTDKDMGVVSAFGVAKENGWTGTEAEWEALQAAAPQKASDAEAYAAGTRSGTAVDSDDPAYQNNAKYYKEQAAGSATAAAGSATAAEESEISAAASAANALEHTQNVIETWLENNIDPDSGYALDRTLAISTAAAPADMVGDFKNAFDFTFVDRELSTNYTKGSYWKSSDGTTASSNKYIRSSNTIYGVGKTNAVELNSATYRFGLIFLDANGNVVGNIGTTDLNVIKYIPKTAVTFAVNIKRSDDANVSDSDVTAVRGLLKYYTLTDRTLTKENAPADAYETGVKFATMRSRYNGKKISIIGDSIDTYNQAGYKIDGYTMYYPSLGVDDVNKTWWKQVIDTSGAKIEVNASYSGSRVTNTVESRPDFYDRVNLIGSPDIIFVTLGTNDSNYEVSLGNYDFETVYTNLDESTFRTAYIKGIKGLQATYPNADIICIAQKMNTAYRNSISTIANTLGCTFIDASDYIAESGVHPGVKGMLQIASMVLFPTDETFTQKHIPADAKKTAERFTQSDTNIAPVYSSANTYNKGDYVYYNNELYKCVRAITTGESWDALKWKRTSLDKEIETDEINYSQSRRFTGSALFLSGWRYGGNITDYGENNNAFICDNQYNALKASGEATIYDVTYTTEADRRIHIQGTVREGQTIAGRYFSSSGKLNTASDTAAAIIPDNGLNYRIVAYITGLQEGQQVDVRRHYANSASVSLLATLTESNPYGAASLRRQDLESGSGACIGVYSTNDGSEYNCDLYLAFIPYAEDEEEYEDEDGYNYDTTWEGKYIYTNYYNRYIGEYAEPVVIAQSDLTVTMKSYLQYKETESIISEAKGLTLNPYLIYQQNKALILTGDGTEYRVQGIAYDSKRKRFGIICPDGAESGKARLLFESNLRNITGENYVTVWSGHSNDITYVPEIDKYVIACMAGGGPNHEQESEGNNSYVCCVDAENGDQTFVDLSTNITYAAGLDYYNGVVYIAGPNSICAYLPDDSDDLTYIGTVTSYMTKTACTRAYSTEKLSPVSFNRAGICIKDGIIYASYSFRMDNNQFISTGVIYLFDLRNGELLGIKTFKETPGEELEGLVNVDGVFFLINDGNYVTARIWDVYHGDITDNQYLYIKENSDLDDLKIQGRHITGRNVSISSIKHKPQGLTSVFCVEVARAGATYSLYQRLISYSGKEYIRFLNTSTLVWGAWKQVGLTEVPYEPDAT